MTESDVEVTFCVHIEETGKNIQWPSYHSLIGEEGSQCVRRVHRVGDGGVN